MVALVHLYIPKSWSHIEMLNREESEREATPCGGRTRLTRVLILESVHSFVRMDLF